MVVSRSTIRSSGNLCGGGAAMADHRSPTWDLRTAAGEEINRAMRLGVVEALRDHKAHGRPIVVWDREKKRVVHVAADDIVIPEGDAPHLAANGHAASPQTEPDPSPID